MPWVTSDEAVKAADHLIEVLNVMTLLAIAAELNEAPDSTSPLQSANLHFENRCCVIASS
jgi:hypothetical protein